LEASWNYVHGRPQKAPVGGQTGEAGDRELDDGAMQRYERANLVHPLGIEMELMVPSRRPSPRNEFESRTFLNVISLWW
jgi:hypothetical protein